MLNSTNTTNEMRVRLVQLIQSKIIKTKLRIHKMTAEAALKFGNEVSVLKKRDEQRLEAAQVKFLRHLLGITKLDKEKYQSFRKKLGHRAQ
jgi:hypothetical protein